MTPYLTLADIAQVLFLPTPALKKTVLTYSIDSRAILPYTLFFAIKGKRHDGHHFLQQVAEGGAVAAVVAASYEGPTFGLELFKVADVTAALHAITKALLILRQQKVIAITGSVGKTTTKELALQLLTSCYSVAATQGNQNTQLTLPLTILNADSSARLLLLEMGMTHKGQIAQLTTLAQPHIALITNISYSHGENFATLADIAKAKAELFTHSHADCGLFLDESAEREHLDVGSCPKRTFSMVNPQADYFLKVDNIEPLRVTFMEQGEERLEASLPFSARHNAQNLLAAAALARTAGVPWEAIAKVIPTLKLPAWRWQQQEREGILFINDGYNNASPDAACSALQALPPPRDGGRRVAVLSEMRELGAFSLGAHKRVAEEALGCVDVLICLGPESLPMVALWQEAQRPCYFFATSQEVASFLPTFLQHGDVVLVKGSRFYDLPQMLAKLELPRACELSLSS